MQRREDLADAEDMEGGIVDVVVMDVDEVVDMGSQGIGSLLDKETPPHLMCQGDSVMTC